MFWTRSRAATIAAGLICLLLVAAQLPALAGDHGSHRKGDRKVRAAVASMAPESTREPETQPTEVPTPEQSTPEPTPEPTLEQSTPQPTPESTLSPTPEQPTPAPSPTPADTPAPTPSVEATATPAPSVEADPRPSTAPTAPPDPSSVPSDPPSPSASPSAAPDPSAVPSPGPSVVPGPSAAPSSAPSAPPSPPASSDPSASPDPSAVPSPDASASPDPSASPSPAPSAAAPQVRTDLQDYAPGSLVLLMGEGWVAGESVAIEVNDDLGRTWQHQATVTAGDDGRFEHEFRLPERFVATYTVVATGPQSGEAAWRFDDSIGAGPGTSNSNGSPATSEITIATPSASADELLLATIVVESLRTNQVICTPAGWTSIGRRNNGRYVSVATFYRVATGSDASSYTWRFRTSAAGCGGPSGGVSVGAVGGITSYTGVDTGSPIVAWSGASRTGSHVDAPSVGGAPADAFVVRAFGNNGRSAISVSGTSSSGVPYGVAWSRVRSAGSLPPAGAAAHAEHPGGGATGTLRATSGSSVRWAAQTIVLRPDDDPTAISLTISDGDAELGADLTPDGEPSDSDDAVTELVDASDPSQGACYAWPGSVRVTSDGPYHLTVTAAAANARLGFLVADPADYDACASGEAVGPAMFGSASPAGSWVTGQTATPGRGHDFWLGLDVRWEDEPSATLGDATLTLEVVADW